jgi:hypothetical protein
LDLQQNGSVAEYTAEFEALQYQITMHDLGMGVAYFISQFIKGLKPEIRYQLQVQVPAIMERAVRLAQIQETIQEKSKSKLHKNFGTAKQSKMSKNLRLQWASCPRNDSSGIYSDLIIFTIIVENHMILLMLLNALRDPKL